MNNGMLAEQGTTGTIGSAQIVAKEQTALSFSVSQLAALVNRIGVLEGKLRSHMDRLVGPQPEAETGSNMAEPTCDIDSLNIQIQLLTELANKIEDQVERLGRF